LSNDAMSRINTKARSVAKTLNGYYHGLGGYNMVDCEEFALDSIKNSNELNGMRDVWANPQSPVEKQGNPRANPTNNPSRLAFPQKKYPVGTPGGPTRGDIPSKETPTVETQGRPTRGDYIHPEPK
jgi:hypothetical protein